MSVRLGIVMDPIATRPANAALLFWQIGGEGGFLPTPVMLEQLLLAAIGPRPAHAGHPGGGPAAALERGVRVGLGQAVQFVEGHGRA